MSVLSDRLNDHYLQLEGQSPSVDDATYGDLVVPNGNDQSPFHRWFHLKEGFSDKLLEKVMSDCHLENRSSLWLLDPYAGGGTGPLSAVLDKTRVSGESAFAGACGIERNPFLQFVASTKIQAAQYGSESFKGFFEQVIELVNEDTKEKRISPALSTFHNPDYFDSGSLQDLLRIREAIYQADGRSLDRSMARLCLAATIEPASYLRRDGRALRFVPKKRPPSVKDEFKRRANEVIEDLVVGPQSKSVGSVHLGDGRRPSSAIPSNRKFDLILFSPPYLNNIDYTEVYKLEAWFLGFISDSIEFKRQRLLTLRSHPSIAFPDTVGASSNGYKEGYDLLIDPVLAEVPKNRDAPWRRRLIHQYFEDILETLINCKENLNKGGRIVVVVGNSLHGSGEDMLMIGTDLLVGGLGRMAGLEIEQFIVARLLNRRSIDANWQRESVIILRNQGDQ